MKPALTAISIALSVILYLPTFSRILERRKTADYSIPAQWCIAALQVVNGLLAAFSRSWWLVGIYALNLALISVTIGLIYKFYDN